MKTCNIKIILVNVLQDINSFHISDPYRNKLSICHIIYHYLVLFVVNTTHPLRLKFTTEDLQQSWKVITRTPSGGLEAPGRRYEEEDSAISLAWFDSVTFRGNCSNNLVLSSYFLSR